jgi:hypothetical protein
VQKLLRKACQNERVELAICLTLLYSSYRVNCPTAHLVELFTEYGKHMDAEKLPSSQIDDDPGLDAQAMVCS